jgi:Toprim domain
VTMTMTEREITYESIRPVGHHSDIYDVPCPLCGPGRRSETNRRRKVFRVWQVERGFLTYSCARCGAHGWARPDRNESQLRASSPIARGKERSAPAVSDVTKRERACWLWNIRQPINGSPAETYLRHARGYRGPLAPTLGFLAARAQHPPAMIAAFGFVDEAEPGMIALPSAAVRGVHLTRLAPDGRAKAGTESDKLMIGTPRGAPIIVAPPNDLGGLAITEGIEDALSVHEATGLEAWAAGAASFLPALAEAVPERIECITIVVDDDPAGHLHAGALAERLERMGRDVRLVVPGQVSRSLP